MPCCPCHPHLPVALLGVNLQLLEIVPDLDALSCCLLNDSMRFVLAYVHMALQRIIRWWKWL